MFVPSDEGYIEEMKIKLRLEKGKEEKYEKLTPIRWNVGKFKEKEDCSLLDRIDLSGHDFLLVMVLYFLFNLLHLYFSFSVFFCICISV